MDRKTNLPLLGADVSQGLFLGAAGQLNEKTVLVPWCPD